MFRAVLGKVFTETCGRVGGTVFKPILAEWCSQLPTILKTPLGIPSSRFCSTLNFAPITQNRSLLQPKVPEIKLSRTLIKYSLQSGKRKSVKAVLKRFYRLDWGIWIRTKCGRQKKIYKKSWNRRRRLRQHVFTNATQSWLLDTMVTRYWRRPKNYPDDPYNPYHKREEFYLTRKKPYNPVAY